ncbi:MAG TPA: hypothetical protein VKV05_06450 [Terriglobales bacterium]|jgi:hypothetical protein|nr:hypothetical protein [Terriglobales bacterium]
MHKAHIPASVVILSIFLAASGEYAPVLGHYWAQFDGVVVARKDNVRFPPWTRNRANRYVIRDADGTQRVYYADSGEGDLDGFPIGARLTKQRWRMDYQENGRPRDDFPFGIYILPMMLDGLLLGAAVILVVMIRVRDNRNRNLQADYERALRRLESGD